MKHLETDQIVALIEHRLNEVDCKDVEEHISSCDLCFTYYASYKSSNLEIENAEIEKTPHDIFIKLFKGEGLISELPSTPTTQPEKGHFFSPNIHSSYTSKLTYLFAPLSFVVLLTFMVYTDYTSDPSIPMASQNVEAEWLEKEEVMTMVSAKTDKVENSKNEQFRASQPFEGIDDILSPPQYIIDSKKIENYPTNILAYFEPEKKKIITRSISSSYVVPNLSGMQFDDIEKVLQIESVRYIIYSHHEFKQIPEPGKFLYQADTLKIYINNK